MAMEGFKTLIPPATPASLESLKMAYDALVEIEHRISELPPEGLNSNNRALVQEIQRKAREAITVVETGGVRVAPDSRADCATHDGYFECRCKGRFIHSKKLLHLAGLCPICMQGPDDERPDARVADMHDPDNWCSKCLNYAVADGDFAGWPDRG